MIPGIAVILSGKEIKSDIINRCYGHSVIKIGGSYDRIICLSLELGDHLGCELIQRRNIVIKSFYRECHGILNEDVVVVLTIIFKASGICIGRYRHFVTVAKPVT